MNTLSITFSGALWEVQEKGGWHFVTLPRDDAEQIKFFTSDARVGFGSVKVTATIGETVWETSIFPGYKIRLLPAARQSGCAQTRRSFTRAIRSPLTMNIAL